MKPYGILCIIISVILLLAPLASLKSESSAPGDSSEPISEDGQTGEKQASDPEDGDTISVFMTAGKKTEKMEMHDYIIGAVSAEMPASYDEEALKAQALAAITFAEYSRKHGTNENLNGADISDDSSMHQGYMSVDDMKEKWGDAYDTYYEKIADAVDEVLDKVITYNGEPIMAAYHAISTGQTESAENIWGQDIPYLKSVKSEGDPYSARFASETTFSTEELKNAVNLKFSGDEEDMIQINSVSDAGTVLSVTVCGKEMTGMELRNLLALKSPSFTAEYSDGVFTFHVKGYGHGVGMSQYGADYYAKQGMTYDEIIQHYYPGTKITDR